MSKTVIDACAAKLAEAEPRSTEEARIWMRDVQKIEPARVTDYCTGFEHGFQKAIALLRAMNAQRLAS